MNRLGFYRRKVQKCQATGAVDILALSETELFLIEVKYFRTHRIENKQRVQHAELADDVAQKVRDTIAGLYGAYRCHASILAPFYNYLFANPKSIKEKRDSRKITAMLFLEEDSPSLKYRNLKVVHRYLRENMDMRLKFLQVRCHVYNKKTLPKKFGWQVTG